MTITLGFFAVTIGVTIGYFLRGLAGDSAAREHAQALPDTYRAAGGK